MKLPFALLAVVFSLAAAPLVERPAWPGEHLIAITWAGEVHTVDPDTGVATYLGDSGWSNTNAMARDDAGRVFASSTDVLGLADLIELDPDTGAGTFVAELGVADVRGMAFGSDGLLYLVEESGPSDLLHRFDPDTGITTLVGPIGMWGIQALERWGNQLVGWDLRGPGSQVNYGLVAINPATGVGTDLNPAVAFQCCEIQTLVTDGAGGLLGMRSALFSVKAGPGGADDRAAGVGTLLGPDNGLDLRGMEWVVTPASR